MASVDDDDDITGPARYGADKKNLQKLYKKKIQITQISSEESSEESDSSSSSSSSDEEAAEHDVPRVSHTEKLDPNLGVKNLRAKISVEAQNYTLPSYGNNLSGELEKLKSQIRSVSQQVVEVDDDSDGEEAPPPKPPSAAKKKLRRWEESDDEESELEDDDVQEVKNTSNERDEEDEEVEEEELEEFFIKFASDTTTKISINPKSPLQIAFDKFCALPANKNRRFVFKFDGEVVRGSQTAKSLDLESGDQIDVKVK